MAKLGYLIAGNWKMNGCQDDALVLAKAVAAGADIVPDSAELLICPPALHLSTATAAIADSAVMLGGQDCHEAEGGAFTGDISPEMLKDVGCSHVIVGHSERRDGHSEGDALVWRKATAALRAGLVAIVCVGETEQERLAGQAEETVARQVKASVPDGADGTRIAVAYEPVWAIGSGRTPNNDEIAAVHAAIRAALVELLGAERGSSIKLLYGGSVKPGNAKEILAIQDVNGALIGGASLKAEDFLAIAAAAA
ncbi:MAG: triose-phosphate isomerase [Alphaproteobacteria bacterium]